MCLSALCFFLRWYHKLFKHMLREEEETGCFDFRPFAEGNVGQGHRDYSKQYSATTSKLMCSMLADTTPRAGANQWPALCQAS